MRSGRAGLGIVTLVGLACGSVVAIMASATYQSRCELGEFQAQAGGLVTGVFTGLVAVATVTLVSVWYVATARYKNLEEKAIGCAGVELLALGAFVIGFFFLQVVLTDAVSC